MASSANYGWTQECVPRDINVLFSTVLENTSESVDYYTFDF